MTQFARAAFVFLLASSLLTAQNSELFAQSQPSAPVVTLDNLVAFNSGPTTPAAFSERLSFDTPPTAMPAQASSSSSRKRLLIAGFAMVAAGAVMVGRKEPVHQTTCIAYDACPVPGIVRISGAMLVGVGGSILLFKLKHD
jgi:hypothetical protein